MGVWESGAVPARHFTCLVHELQLFVLRRSARPGLGKMRLMASSSLAASSACTVSFRASAASLVALRRSCARVATSSAAPPSPSALVPRALRPPSPLSPRPRPRPHPDHCTPQKNALRGAQGRFAPSSKDFSLPFCRTRKPQTHEEEPRGSAAATPAGREGGARPQVVRSRRHWCVWGSGWGAGDILS